MARRTSPAFWPLLLLLGIVFAGGALWSGTTLVRELGHARDSPTWPTVDGEVTSSYLQSSAHRRGRRSRAPRVTFAYAVDGQRYESRRVSFLPARFGDGDAVVARYAQGSRVLVRYRPDAPEVAVLEPGLRTSGLVAHGAITLVVLGAGVAMAAGAVRRLF